jgi:hypothetical protein
MAKKNLPKIVVITDISNLETPDMITAGGGIVLTLDPDATAPPVADTVLHTEADDLQTVHNNRQTEPPTATANDEIGARDTLAFDYQQDARYVESIANKVAKAAGDVTAGIAVVNRTGFKLKKTGIRAARHFEIYASGIEWAHVRTKSVAKVAAYVWRFGITPIKGTPPAIEGSRAVVNLEADLKITNLKSGTIYGIQFAAVKRKEKRTYSNGEEPLIYSDWIYFVVQ